MDISILSARLVAFVIASLLLAYYAAGRAGVTPRLFIPIMDPPDRTDLTAGMDAVHRLRKRIDIAIREDSAPSAREAWDFAHRLLKVDAYRGRVIEQVDLNDGFATMHLDIEVLKFPNSDDPHVRASIQAATPKRAKSSLIKVPLARFKRGRLISELSIRDRNGARVNALLHDEAALYVGCCATRLLHAALQKQPDQMTPRQLETLELIRNVVDPACVGARGIKTSDLNIDDRAQLHMDKISLHLQADPSIDPDPVSLKWLTYFIAFVEANYPLILEVDFDEADRASFSCSHTIEMDLSQPRLSTTGSRASKEKCKDALRSLLGIDIHTFYLDASRSRRSPSFHLEIRAPSNSYIGEKVFYDAETNTAITPKHQRGIYNDATPYYRCHTPKGGERAHLYTRGFIRHESIYPSLYIRFVEKPPGSLGRAWVMSLAILMIIWFFGIFDEIRVGAPESTHGVVGLIDPAALLLAVPVALWAWMGMVDRSQRSPTLLAQVSIIISTVIAFIALLLLQLLNAGRLDKGKHIPSIAGVNNLFWGVLLGLAFVHATWTGVVMLLRWWRWRGLRTQPTDNHKYETPPKGLAEGV